MKYLTCTYKISEIRIECNTLVSTSKYTVSYYKSCSRLVSINDRSTFR